MTMDATAAIPPSTCTLTNSGGSSWPSLLPFPRRQTKL
jgi:hypothetical protein